MQPSGAKKIRSPSGNLYSLLAINKMNKNVTARISNGKKLMNSLVLRPVLLYPV